MAGTTGKTKDAGWQMGVRRTLPIAAEDAWEFLVGEGLPLWLGHTSLGDRAGEPYVTEEGVSGELRSRTDGRRVRLTWRPSDWSHDTTLQLTVLPAATGATIAVHQERLADADERERMLTHWTAVLETLGAALSDASD
ncbi:MAG: SRPBCC domain-containing protein [Aeromicrobium sp.]|uniref:SRPBCC domain-containing protein n=1 Tax=Aeromicrobium sp. TaxID=1871063 RepID=UPI0039E38FBB